MGTSVLVDPPLMAGVAAVRNYEDVFGSLVAGALNADLVPGFDVAGYREFSLQIGGTWSGTLSFYGSNDGVVYYPLAVVSVAGGSTVTSTTGNGFFVGILPGMFFRVRMTAFVSGSATGVLRLSTLPMALDLLIGSIGVSGVASVAGNVAHDAVDSGNPVKIGGKALLNDPASVMLSGKRVDAYFDVLGKQVVVPHAVRGQIVAPVEVVLTASTTETPLLVPAGAGVFVDVSWISLTNTSATPCTVQLRSASGSSVLRTFCVPALSTVHCSFADVPLLQSTANGSWTVQCLLAVSSLYVTVGAFKRAG